MSHFVVPGNQRGRPRSLAGRRARQTHLREGYLFDCSCAGCAGADVLRRLPCPRCCPRTAATGQLARPQEVEEADGAQQPPWPAMAGVMVRRRPVAADGCCEEWRWCCESCAASLSDAEVDIPCKFEGGDRRGANGDGGGSGLLLELPSPSSLFEWERRVEDATTALVDRIDEAFAAEVGPAAEAAASKQADMLAAAMATVVSRDPKHCNPGAPAAPPSRVLRLTGVCPNLPPPRGH
eukprot:SAG22_NODE_5109_length_1084_cov_1.332995_2_plen_237_part_00